MTGSSGMGDLFTLSVVIAAGFLVAVAFYESMSTRDVLVAWGRSLGRRLGDGRRTRVATYLLVVGVLTPILVVLWAVVLEIVLFIVGSVDRVESVALIAASIVAATRILAYVRERTSHELAKAVPLAFAFLLLTGGALNLDVKLTGAIDHPAGTSLTDEMVLFLVALEVVLRVVTDGTHVALDGFRRRRGIPPDLGAWRIAWLAIRGRLPEEPGAGVDIG